MYTLHIAFLTFRKGLYTFRYNIHDVYDEIIPRIIVLRISVFWFKIIKYRNVCIATNTIMPCH